MYFWGFDLLLNQLFVFQYYIYIWICALVKETNTDVKNKRSRGYVYFCALDFKDLYVVVARGSNKHKIAKGHLGPLCHIFEGPRKL